MLTASDGQCAALALTLSGSCVKMSNMKKATIREVQHNLAGVLRWVEDGEEVQVMRRNQIVARIVPADRASKRPRWPDFAGRAEAIWGKHPRGKPASKIIIEDREERM